MKYLKQHDVMNRLAMDAKKIMRDRIENPAATMLRDHWKATKDDITAFARGVWSQTDAQDGLHLAEPARHRIQRHIERTMHDFRDTSVHIIHTASRQAFELQYQLNHWMLDQVTPKNISVKPKRDATLLSHPMVQATRKFGRRVKESHVHESWFTDPVEGSPLKDGESSTEQRIDGYTKSWTGAAITSLMLGGVQGDSPEDIEARLDGTTAAGSQLDGVLDRNIRSQVQVSIADADDEFLSDYGDLVQERIWMTMDDERVCADCESQDGLLEPEWEFYMPVHPRCRCWARMLPQGFQQLAGELAVPGVPDDAMVILDPVSREPVGTLVVEFSGWRQEL